MVISSEQLRPAQLGIDDHGAELVDSEHPPVLAHPYLRKQHRAAVMQPDHHPGQGEQGKIRISAAAAAHRSNKSLMTRRKPDS